MAAAAFSRGELVEVASREEGFVGSYFEATVVAKNDATGGGYIIQYETLREEENDQSRPLREVASAAEIRPRPPKVAAAAFHCGDVVDAFDNDGWWVGKITGRLCGGRSYRVSFEDYSGKYSYPKNQLRFHQDWLLAAPGAGDSNNRVWVFASDQSHDL